MRHTKAKDKLSRKYGELLSGMPMFEINKRPYPPGQHGLKRTKNSEYVSLLQEKQKLKYSYGVQENQFRRYFQKATKIKGPTGEILIQLLETRLDNLVYRFGFAPTLAAARQLVTHGHVLVNNKKVDIPSYQLRVKDEISLKPTKEKVKIFADLEKRLAKYETPAWLSFDPKTKMVKIISQPGPEAMEQSFSPRLIVEFYSK